MKASIPTSSKGEKEDEYPKKSHRKRGDDWFPGDSVSVWTITGDFRPF